MKVVILDGMESENPVENILKELLEDGVEAFSYFKLKDMNILPCKSCGACSYKNVGKCIFNDHSHDILRALAPCDMVVMVTPVRFGGYGSQLKKASDKLPLMAIPTFMVKEGHLLHPPRYGTKSLLAIGFMEEDSQAQEESFRTLIANNGLNLQYKHKTLMFKASEDGAKIKNEIENAIKGGN